MEACTWANESIEDLQDTQWRMRLELSTFMGQTGIRYRGNIYIGEIKDGKCHGAGKDFWLQSAPTWN